MSWELHRLDHDLYQIRYGSVEATSVFVRRAADGRIKITLFDQTSMYLNPNRAALMYQALGALLHGDDLTCAACSKCGKHVDDCRCDEVVARRPEGR